MGSSIARFPQSNQGGIGSLGRLGSRGRELIDLHIEEASKLLPRGPVRIKSERNRGIPLDFIDWLTL